MKAGAGRTVKEQVQLGSWTWWHRPIILALRRLRHDCEFKTWATQQDTLSQNHNNNQTKQKNRRRSITNKAIKQQPQQLRSKLGSTRIEVVRFYMYF
jgi:hypothetical protein